MSREEINGPNDAEFEETLRKSFRDLKRRRATCPDAEELAKYYAGKLSDERSSQVKNHVEACGVCDLLLERLKRFDQAVEWGGPDLPPSTWEDTDQRLTNRMEAFLNSQAPPTTTTSVSNGGATFSAFHRLRELLRSPAIGYVIALMLCYPAYLGITSKLRPTIPPEMPKTTAVPPQATKPTALASGVQSARLFDLNAVRGNSRRSDRLELTERDKVFGLSFFVPVRGTHRYTAAIRNEAGATIAIEQELPNQETGNFTLFCDRQLFSPGGYQLTLKEFDRKTGQISRTIVFRFRI